MSLASTIEFICRIIANLVKAVWSFPQSVATAIQQRRQQTASDALETERLDRIRNPSRYLGKQ